MARSRRFLPRFIWQSLIYLVIAYIAIVGTLFLFQSRIVYVPNTPSRELAATPQRAGLQYVSDVSTYRTDLGV